MNKPTTKKDIRTFGIGLAVMLAGFASVSSYWHGQLRLLWMYVISGVLLPLALFVPNLLKPIYKGWMKVAHAIGWFNTRLLLALIYYVVFTPIGVLVRLFGKDLLNVKLEPQTESYWIKREHKEMSQTEYEKQF
jgi:hypothetical protein